MLSLARTFSFKRLCLRHLFNQLQLAAMEHCQKSFYSGTITSVVTMNSAPPHEKLATPFSFPLSFIFNDLGEIGKSELNACAMIKMFVSLVSQDKKQKSDQILMEVNGQNMFNIFIVIHPSSYLTRFKS